MQSDRESHPVSQSKLELEDAMTTLLGYQSIKVGWPNVKSSFLLNVGSKSLRPQSCETLN